MQSVGTWRCCARQVSEWTACEVVSGRMCAKCAPPVLLCGREARVACRRPVLECVAACQEGVS
jgi:hypothetical protein